MHKFYHMNCFLDLGSSNRSIYNNYIFKEGAPPPYFKSFHTFEELYDFASSDCSFCSTGNSLLYDRFVTFHCTEDNLTITAKTFKAPVIIRTQYKECSTKDYNFDFFKENLSIPNQYLIAHSPADSSVQAFKWASGKHVAVDYKPFETQAFGAVRAKEKDIYQMLAFDSLLHNQITMLCGPAGTGKSYLALAYMLKLLETHKIDKIIVFTNPCATSGAARLGFYPGTRNEKLLDSQIGNMLGAKLGDTLELKRYIDANEIQLLPFSDLRGFDTTGKNCAVYITEAQNLDIEMMRLALQRIGEDSICIIDGDYDAQVDLDIYSGDNNGMRRLSQVFRGQDFYGEVKLQKIYRSRIAALAQEM